MKKSIQLLLILPFFSFQNFNELEEIDSRQIDRPGNCIGLLQSEPDFVPVILAVVDGDCYYSFTGYVDLNDHYNYTGTAYASGPPPCPNGTWPVSNSETSGNIQFNLEEGPWCAASDMNFSARGGGVNNDILNALNYNRLAILEEIQKDCGC